MLSDRQLLILKLKKLGKTHKQISAELGLSLSVVLNDSARAQRKLSVPSEAYERFVSRRTAGVLRSKFGPGTVTPAVIKKYITSGKLSF